MSLGLKGLRNTTAECTKQTHRKVKEGNTKHTESQRDKTKQNTQKVTEGQHKTYSNTQKVKEGQHKTQKVTEGHAIQNTYKHTET